MLNLKQITYYGYYFENGNIDSSGDHWGIKIINDDTGKTVIEYGDEYHDKGESKVEGFFDGLRFAGIRYSLTYEDQKHKNAELADWEEDE